MTADPTRDVAALIRRGLAPGHGDGRGDGRGDGSPPDPLAPLQERIGHVFRDRGLLVQAMTHRSWCAEHPGGESNERLEFLGDAVLGLAVTDHIFDAFPALSEGQLAKVRAGVVNATVLAESARELSLGRYVRLGRGEDQSGGRDKTSILSDTLEALLGAVHLDGGRDVAIRLVLDLLADRIEGAAAVPGRADFKTRLQELTARTFDAVPRYLVDGSGPDHAKVFHATVLVRGDEMGRGAGRSKKEAEQEAARVAWYRLTEGREPPPDESDDTHPDDAPGGRPAGAAHDGDNDELDHDAPAIGPVDGAGTA
jgi:ribonuclease III